MAILFTDILQDGDYPVCSVDVYAHFNDIVFYTPFTLSALKGLVFIYLGVLSFS
jgi:hypothetical protein